LEGKGVDDSSGRRYLIPMGCSPSKSQAAASPATSSDERSGSIKYGMMGMGKGMMHANGHTGHHNGGHTLGGIAGGGANANAHGGSGGEYSKDPTRPARSSFTAPGVLATELDGDDGDHDDGRARDGTRTNNNYGGGGMAERTLSSSSRAAGGGGKGGHGGGHPHAASDAEHDAGGRGARASWSEANVYGSQWWGPVQVKSS
jgi:hypothetical protein